MNELNEMKHGMLNLCKQNKTDIIYRHTMHLK